MKKAILICLFLVLMSFFANAEILRFSMINQDPDPVLAGDVVELRFKVENLWEDTKNDVKVEVVQEYPFSMYSSSAIKNLGRVEGREEGSEPVFFDFKLKVDPNAVDGNHEVVLNVYDEENTVYKLEDNFYVDVENERIALKPYISSSDFIIGGSSGKFTIEIANIGGEDVDSLELELLDSEDYRLLSTSNYVYIGNLESDDTESEEFRIYVDEGIRTVKIPVKLKYGVRDNNYEQDFSLSLNLLTNKEARKLGLIKTNYAPHAAAVVIAIIIVFFAVRKYRKR